MCTDVLSQAGKGLTALGKVLGNLSGVQSRSCRASVCNRQHSARSTAQIRCRRDLQARKGKVPAVQRRPEFVLERKADARTCTVPGATLYRFQGTVTKLSDTRSHIHLGRNCESDPASESRCTAKVVNQAAQATPICPSGGGDLKRPEAACGGSLSASSDSAAACRPIPSCGLILTGRAKCSLQVLKAGINSRS